MTSNTKMVIGFISGGLIGSLITKEILDKKHDEELKEVYQSAIDYYSTHPEDYPDEPVLSQHIQNDYESLKGMVMEKYKQPDLKDLQASIHPPTDYSTYSKVPTVETTDKELELVKMDPLCPTESSFIRLYPDEDSFEVPHGYEEEVYILYSDGVLADSYGDVIENIGFTIGEGNLNYFKNNLVDSVMYIQNEATHILYEVTREEMSYADAYSAGPPED